MEMRSHNQSFFASSVFEGFMFFEVARSMSLKCDIKILVLFANGMRFFRSDRG